MQLDFVVVMDMNIQYYYGNTLRRLETSVDENHAAKISVVLQTSNRCTDSNCIL